MASSQFGGQDQAALDAAWLALDALTDWAAPTIERALRSALVDGLGLRPRDAYTPIRVAITGRPISPPLFELMAALGRDRSLARIRAAQQT